MSAWRSLAYSAFTWPHPASAWDALPDCGPQPSGIGLVLQTTERVIWLVLWHSAHRVSPCTYAHGTKACDHGSSNRGQRGSRCLDCIFRLLRDDRPLRHPLYDDVRLSQLLLG